MKTLVGVLLILAGSGAALGFGFGALMLGGGSSSQTAEAPLQFAGAVVGVIVALWGGSLLSARKPPQA